MFLIALAVALVALASAQTQDRGFSNKEKQFMLDLHNFMRHKVAQGRQHHQPPATYMIAMEWDDNLEAHAQQWADECIPEHAHAEKRRFPVYGEEGESLSGGELMAIKNGFERAFITWFEEEDHSEFIANLCKGLPACGHYKQIIWGNSTRIGCGFNRCPGKAPTIFCRFAPGANGVYYKDAQPMREYITGVAGKQCDDCPQGYSFCMKDGLCASATACAGSMEQCRCTLTACENGGQLDRGKCICNCPSAFEGPRCELECKDLVSDCHKTVDKCHDPTLMQWNLEACRKTCGYCRAFNIKFPEPRPNKYNILTRVLDERPGEVVNRKRGPCKDAQGEEICGIWADQDKCQYRWVKVMCRATCFACNSEKRGPCKDNADPDICTYYQLNGYCEEDKWKESLARSCPGACNMCGQAIPRQVRTGTSEDCRDFHTDEVTCRRLQERGDCENDRQWTRFHCARTCGYCPGLPKGACTNAYEDRACELWAKKGYCDQAWNKENCRRSCNSCDTPPPPGQQ
ncbi:proprotein convertase subtilisin/kexin type 5-like [Lineus longissimus]|uniref:proprotein convertase subtilisin/kexin type 5-like n=1 Tax=Lineus longissimus TaxID=88925 RepID=UPI00315D3131